MFSGPRRVENSHGSDEITFVPADPVQLNETAIIRDIMSNGELGELRAIALSLTVQETISPSKDATAEGM